MYLSIIIPAYNEEENLRQKALFEVENYLSKQKYPFEVIVVDDGSTDATTSLIKKFISAKSNWRLIQNPHQGKAATVKTGILAAKGQYILFTDFDQATPISEIEKLLPFIKNNYQIVIGSREVKGSHRKDEPWYRHLMGKGFNFGVKLIAIRGISDTQCGFKLFTQKAAKKLFNSLVIYGKRKEANAFTGAFDVELLYIAQKRKYNIAEVPVSWRHIHTKRINPFRDSIRMAIDVILIRLADLMGQYQ